jgi:hypothetical protein
VALIAVERLYLKTDAQARPQLAAAPRRSTRVRDTTPAARNAAPARHSSAKMQRAPSEVRKRFRPPLST